MINALMKRGYISKALTGLSLGVFFLNTILALVARAERPVLNQTPDIIERDFGRPVRQGPGFNIYSSVGLQVLIPPTNVFAIYFSGQKANQIVIKFFTPIPYTQAEASALFNYIFGYNPPIWKEIRHDNVSAHDGQRVTDFAYCVGKDIVNEFTTYDSSVDYVSFKINSRCKLPERPGNPK